MENHKEVMIRQVWSHNFEYELCMIHNLLPRFSLVSFDTEFPGVIYPLQHHHRGFPNLFYDNLKKNVDSTSIIQVGISLFNPQGQSPGFAWEFNFKDFNLSRGDLHNPESIQLLQTQGINFDKNADDGIDSAAFRRVLGVLCSFATTWVGFQTAYDFGYLIKIITGAKLPRQPLEFMHMVYGFFGTRVYDLKCMMKVCHGLHGGLETVAKLMEVDRVDGRRHQAGSDSFLTMKLFMKIKQCYFINVSMEAMHRTYGGVFFGLEGIPALQWYI